MGGGCAVNTSEFSDIGLVDGKIGAKQAGRAADSSFTRTFLVKPPS